MGDSPRTLAPGELFAARYRIEQTLGRGGMGTVYRVLDEVLGVRVALKILSAPDSSPEALLRFRREARLARRVTHENVARTFDVGEQDGVHYLTLEYVEGGSLADRLRSNPVIEIAEALRIALGICRGLAAAHAVGVVHRDLKPANVLLDANRRILIGDFGIAASELEIDHDLRTSSSIGTPAYMAPEQLSGGVVDGRADTYSLGLILYELLVGQRAFPGSGVQAALAKLENDGPDPRALRPIPDEIANLVHLMMRRDPGSRPAAAASVARELENALERLDSGVTIRHAPAVGTHAALDSGAPSIPPRGVSLAVLPFRYRGPAADDYLADALAEDLTDWLSRLKGVRVFATSATEPFRTERDPRRVASALGANQIVDATLERHGDEHRIKVRLVEGGSALQLLSLEVRGHASELFSNQERIAMKIAEALRLDVTRLGSSGRASPEALDAYLRGRGALNAIGPMNRRASLAELERAVELAPSFEPAIAGVALGRVLEWIRPSGSVSEREARDSVTRALAEADGLAESHVAAGILASQTGDYASTVRFLAHALELAPTAATALAYFGMLQAESGRTSEGVKRLELAGELDPQLTVVAHSLARHHALYERWSEFEHWCTEMERRGGIAAILRLRIATWHKDQPGVARACDQSRTDNHPFVGLARGYVLGEIDSARVEQMFVDATKHFTNQRTLSHLRQVAVELYLYRDERERAQKHLDMLCETALIDLEWLDRCPLIKTLHDTAVFKRARALVASRVAAMWSQS